MIPQYEEWLNEAKTFIAPSKENAKLTDLVDDITSIRSFGFTLKDLNDKSEKYQEIRTKIDAKVDKKELKRIESKYNSFDRFLNDLILELNPDLK